MIDRRRFMQSMLLGAGSWPLWQGRFAEASREPPGAAGAAGPRLTLAVETSMFHRHKAPEAFGLIRQAGVRYVELSGAHFAADQASRLTIAELKRQLGDADLTAAAAFPVYGISSPDESQRHAAVEKWKRSIAAVQELGVRLVTTELTGTRDRPAEGQAAFRKSMDELLPLLERAQLHLSVEPHPGDFFEAAEPTLKLLSSYRSAHLGYLHCTAHTFYLGPNREVIQQAGQLLTHVHLADSFRSERYSVRSGVGVHMHLRPGVGELDFPQIFQALKEIGYSGYVSLQLFSHADRPTEAVEQAREYLAKLLGDRLAT